MIVTLATIEQMFADLETETKSREFIAEFATAAMKADDSGALVLEPSVDAPRIWKAITYLSGVDIKEPPDAYLHCKDDFVEFRKQLGIAIPTAEWKHHGVSKVSTLEEKFRTLLTELSPSLTATDVEQIRELVDANELGVAFENFCTQLYERDAACSRDQLNQIASLGAAMGISSEYWDHLATT